MLNTATIFEYTHIHIDPPVVNVPPSPQRIPWGNTLTLSCNYESVPPPDVTWLLNSSPLSSTDPCITTTELRSELTLGSLEESERRTYTCSASNIVGGSSRDIEVIVQGECSMPHLQNNCYGPSISFTSRPSHAQLLRVSDQNSYNQKLGSGKTYIEANQVYGGFYHIP